MCLCRCSGRLYRLRQSAHWYRLLELAWLPASEPGRVREGAAGVVGVMGVGRLLALLLLAALRALLPLLPLWLWLWLLSEAEPAPAREAAAAAPNRAAGGGAVWRASGRGCCCGGGGGGGVEPEWSRLESGLAILPSQQRRDWPNWPLAVGVPRRQAGLAAGGADSSSQPLGGEGRRGGR